MMSALAQLDGAQLEYRSTLRVLRSMTGIALTAFLVGAAGIICAYFSGNWAFIILTVFMWAICFAATIFAFAYHDIEVGQARKDLREAQDAYELSLVEVTQ